MTAEASGSFSGVLGRHIFWRSWSPDSGPARAVIVLVHGLGEHSGRYDHVVARLVDTGYAVYDSVGVATFLFLLCGVSLLWAFVELAGLGVLGLIHYVVWGRALYRGSAGEHVADPEL